MKNVLFLRFLRSLLITHLIIVESGKRNYCFEKMSEKFLKLIWIQKSVETLYKLVHAEIELDSLVNLKQKHLSIFLLRKTVLETGVYINRPK